MTSKNSKAAGQIIQTLKAGNFYCECPCGCGKELKLKDADLFYLDNFSPRGQEAHKELLEDLKQQRLDIKERMNQMTTRPKIAAKAINIGFILERIAPAFDHFPFEHSDCRSIYDPIDYVIFEGLTNKGIVTKIIFTDIKTGKARLKNNQKEVKSLVQNKKVEFITYKP